FLVFSGTYNRNNRWTAYEIQNAEYHSCRGHLRPDCYAQLAVLSACKTGLGKIHDAGIIGLARAFQIAGVRRVVMSLWDIDDIATSELMQTFVKYLRSDFPSEALRKAMVEIKARQRPPREWASFELFGTPR